MKHFLWIVLLAGCHTSAAAVASDAPTPSTPQVAMHRAYTKPSADEIKKMLTPLQFEVTQNDATEPPFRNAYWDNHAAGIYVDVVTGEPLFSSNDKFESGTGWPSFTKPIDDAAVKSKSDSTLGMDRTEVRSSSGSSHLGHVFDDGPAPSGMRYCINSASLRFVPLARLEAEGYGAYRARFEGGASHAPVKDTNNACAAPPPGTRAGCSTTLATAILGADPAATEILGKTVGILQIDRGTVHGARALRVTYDPKAVDLAQVHGLKVQSNDESTFSADP